MSIRKLSVEQLPRPWRHPWGTVVDIEFPKDRPKVVDLVFSDGSKTAESRGAQYMQNPDGSWDLAMFGGEK